MSCVPNTLALCFAKGTLYNLRAEFMKRGTKKLSCQGQRSGTGNTNSHLPCSTHISHRKYPQESLGRYTAEDAGFARILLPPASAAGWPSSCPSHSYVLQTGLSSSKQGTGICPLNRNGCGYQKSYLLVGTSSVALQTEADTIRTYSRATSLSSVTDTAH